MRAAKGKSAFAELANASDYPMAVISFAKGKVPETHLHFIGIYWGVVSTSFCVEIVVSTKAYLFVGPILNDYSLVGYSLLSN
jgi:pyruvate decarboxylase